VGDMPQKPDDIHGGDKKKTHSCQDARHHGDNDQQAAFPKKSFEYAFNGF
jgi:hypothetical protein